MGIRLDDALGSQRLAQAGVQIGGELGKLRRAGRKLPPSSDVAGEVELREQRARVQRQPLGFAGRYPPRTVAPMMSTARTKTVLLTLSPTRNNTMPERAIQRVVARSRRSKSRRAA